MKRGRKLSIFGVIAGAFLVLIAVIAIWRGTVSSANSQRLRAIAARGEPTSLPELDKFYKAVPDSNNAALVWLDGAAALTNDLGNIAGKLNLKRGVPLNEDQLRETAEALAVNAEALGLFHRAATLHQSRYPISLRQQPWVANLHHLAPLKGAAQVLRAEAAVAVTQTNTALAAEAINAILAAGRSMAVEPLVISQLVAYAIDIIGIQTLQFALNTASFTGSELEALQAAAAKADDLESASRGLLGERAFFISGLSDPAGLLAATRSNPASGIEEIVSEVFVQPVTRFSGFWQRDLRFGIDALTTSIACARLPDPQRFHSVSNSSALASQARSRYYIMTALFLPALEKFITRDANHRAQARTAVAAVAIERFCLANNGKLPDQLSSLIPKYLEEIPVDPYDGQPLRYKRTDKGYVVYSIGPDGVDDGGIEGPAGPKPKSLWDVTFIVERPESR
jgi:hypothetical protein